MIIGMIKSKDMVSIKTIKLNANKPFGEQMKLYREALKYNYRQFMEISGMPISTIEHFEKNIYTSNGKRKGDITVLEKYAKGLGAKEVLISLT